MTKQEHQIAFYLSLDETCEAINANTKLSELHMMKRAAASDLKAHRYLPKWASQEIKQTITDRIKFLERLQSIKPLPTHF